MHANNIKPGFFILFLIVLTLTENLYGQGVCPANTEVCINRSPFVLSGSTITGGTYSGTGVTTGTFDPTTAGVGIHQITYNYTDGNNQPAICTYAISIYQNVPIACVLEPNSFCINGDPRQISQCQPLGQNVSVSFSGTGITNNIFYPVVAGLGTHSFSMIATDEDGCTGSQTGNVVVYDGSPPIVSCPSNLTVASSSSSPFTINGGTSSVIGETYYSGTGVQSGVFNPSVAGTGSHTITFNANVPYDMELNPMCWSSCTFNISIGTLPVTLITFKAVASEKSIAIAWQTAAESNFDRFEVERSLDVKKGFVKIHQIKGSNSGNAYSFIDNKTEKGIPVYYRLKMIDTDGTYAYSKITWALIEANDKISVYPNPVSREINVGSSLEITEAKLLNMSGNEVFSQTFLPSKNRAISLPDLPKGVYLLQIKNKEGVSAFSKVMIN